MWNAEQIRITGALVISLAAHSLLLGLAWHGGFGSRPVPAVRRSVVMRLTTLPAPAPARAPSRQVAARPVPPVVRVKKQLPPSTNLKRPMPHPKRPAPPVKVAVPVAPAKPAPPVPVEPIPSPAVVTPAAKPAVNPGTARIAPIVTPVAAPVADPVAAMTEQGKSGPAAAVIAPGSAAGGGGEVVLAIPLYRANPPPVYPARARRWGWQGKVVLAVLVGPKGEVRKVEVRDSSGYLVLDEAALAAVRNWRFVPGSRGGVAAAMEVLVPVKFGLR